MIRELIVAYRNLRRAWPAALASVFALALGIGATTTMYSGISAVILRPFPFPDLDHLVRIWDTDPEHDAMYNKVSLPDFADWRDTSTTLTDLAAYTGWSAVLTGDVRPERLQGFAVTPSFFEALGVRPAHGRTLGPQDTEAGAPPAIVISHGLWSRVFPQDQGIPGPTLRLNDTLHPIVGVMPEGFDYPLGTDVWRALGPDSAGTREVRSLFVLGRLRSGEPIQRARAEMTAIAARLAAEYPASNDGHGIRIQPILSVTNVGTDRFMKILFLASGFVLLLACVNVGNILVARLASREPELAVRSALGAGRWRLVGHLLSESMVLAAFGGLIGVLIALWGVDLMRTAVPEQVHRWVAGLRNLRVDTGALVFAAVVSLAAVALCTSFPGVPLLRRKNLFGGLLGGGRGTATGPGAAKSAFRRRLVAIETGLALVLILLAGLMVRTFQSIWTMDPGFDPKGVSTMRIDLPADRFTARDRIQGFWEDLLLEAERIPGISSAGIGSPAGAVAMTGFSAQGRQPPESGRSLPDLRLVTSGYFSVMGLPIAGGRLFTPFEDAGGSPLAVISESVARQYFDDVSEAIGGVIHVEGHEFPPLTVVGVIGDTRDWFTAEPEPRVYTPASQMPQRGMEVILRTDPGSEGMISVFLSALRSLDSELPAYDVKSLEQSLKELTSGVRLSAATMIAFALIALILAVTGIYGVVSYSVTSRSREIGIRLTLGAEPLRIQRQFISQTLRPALLGLVIGAVIVIALTRVMASVLEGIVLLDADAITLGALALLLASVTVAAVWLPARRATRVDPVQVLHSE